MSPAFISTPSWSLRPLSLRRATSTAPLRMTSASRPTAKQIPPKGDEYTSASNGRFAPEIAAISVAVCEFMNKEHVRDISNYVIKFGRKFDDFSQLTAVKMTALDASGFTADVVSCDESHCVCVQERLDWPLGLCHNAGDVITALKHLSTLCGLPAEF